MSAEIEQSEAPEPIADVGPAPSVGRALDQVKDDALTFVNHGTAEDGYVADIVPAIAVELSWGALVSRQHVEDEIDLMLRAVRGCWDMFPDQVMRAVSAMSARCSELYVHLHRLEGRREWKQIRTQQVETLLAELDRQFKIHSRLLEVQKFEALQEGRQT
jgi:hypothetical protein